MWHQLDAGMFVVVILLVLLIPLNIYRGEYLSAVCNALWVLVGYKAYRLHVFVTEKSSESLEIIEEQDKLIRALKEVIHNIIVKQDVNTRNNEKDITENIYKLLRS